MKIKGYVVRGTWRSRVAGGEIRDVYAYWWDCIGDVQWITDRAQVPHDGRLMFPTIGEADMAQRKSSHLADVRIHAVAEDGTETPMPTYEEALAQLNLILDATESIGFTGPEDRATERVDLLLASRDSITRQRDEALAENERLRTLADRLDAHRATLRRAEEEIEERYPGAAFDVGAALEAIEDTIRALRASVPQGPPCS